MPSPNTEPSHWPHRIAVTLCCATFPLIWVGGLVTTYDAGMAVPDWPTTYGYNLFLYPLETWFFGPWDLFIEHGHRLLGAVVGMLTTVFAIAVWRADERRWMHWLALGAIVLVALQGLLGGARVLLNDRQLALVHGCLGPGFFSYCVALAVCTSATWRTLGTKQHSESTQLVPPRLWRLAAATACLAYLQLILGAFLRHLPVMAKPGTFQIFVLFHVLTGVVLIFHVIRLTYLARKDCREVAWIATPPAWLLGLLTLQLVLGFGTWVVKYGWPHWLGDWQIAANYTVTANSLLQGTVVTAHVAVGSLILACSAMVSLRALRLAKLKVTAVGSSALLVGVVG